VTDPSLAIRSLLITGFWDGLLRDDDGVARWIRSYSGRGGRDLLLGGRGQRLDYAARRAGWAEPAPSAAASLVEWKREHEVGRIQEYQAKYGFLADQPVTRWDPGFPHEDLTQEQYEKVWIG